MARAKIVGNVELKKNNTSSLRKKMSPKKRQKIEKKLVSEKLAKRQIRETSLRLFRKEKFGDYKKLTRAEKRESRQEFFAT